MKKTLLLLVAVLIATTINAQQFDWAKEITTSDSKIIKTATDSQGNLYIFGTCSANAEYNNVRLLPSINGIGTTSNVIIAKINANGEMLWHKVIAQDNGQLNSANYMQLVGDSSVVFMAEITLPTPEYKLYYLDTLIAPTSFNDLPTYPFVNRCGGSCSCTAVIRLDLDGNLKEQHSIQIKYIDSTNNEIISYDTFAVRNPLFYGGETNPFYIDNNGNIYIYKIGGGYDDVTAKGMRIVIDTNEQYDVDYGFMYNNSRLLKFSPHFDSVLWCKPLIKDTVGNGANPITMQPYITGMTGDNEGNIYACGYIDHSLSIVDTNYYRTLILDSNNLNQTIELKSFEQEVSFLIKYNSNGNVIYAKQLKSNIDYSANYNVPIMSVFNGLTLNENNTSIFVLGSAQKNYFNDTSSNHSQFVIDNNVLDLRNNVFFIRFNKDNGNYISYGKVNTPYTSSIRGILSNHDIVSHNNQLFTQFEYTGDLYLRDTVYHNTFGVFRLAMIRWDDEGHVIGGIDYNAVGNNNYSSSTTIDNNGNLYLTGTITSGASFGTNTLTNGAYIAKYTDSTFNTPYIYQSIGEIQNIGGISIYPNPTQNEINITTQQERIKSCKLTTLDGKEYNFKPIMNDSNGAKINIESMPIGTYILTVKTNKNIYHNKVVKIK
jgi:hypothetical protein